MTDLYHTVSTLRRPRLLIRAARFGQRDYNRTRDLRRLMKLPATPAPAQALERLIAEESMLDSARREGVAHYSLMRHIEVLIAMMAEARLLRPPEPGA